MGGDPLDRGDDRLHGQDFAQAEVDRPLNRRRLPESIGSFPPTEAGPHCHAEVERDAAAA